MIDTNSFKYKDTRWGDLYMHLKSKGLEVYSPGAKVGECERPYVIPKFNGSDKHNSFSTLNSRYEILCYVPINNYSYVEEYVSKVKNIMKELHPMFKFTGHQDPPFPDDSIKAIMVGIEYINYVKL